MTVPLLASDPRHIGDYTVTGRLGEGGQGVVYLGTSPPGQQVAIKLLRTHLSGNARARSRFLRELSVAERVSGFCTAAVVDADMAGDQPYIVSEFVPGPPLQDLREPLPEPDLRRLAIGTATALAAIHQAGIVHRDFKPANVIMAPGGPRVIDFGIARLLDADVTLTSQIVGTPAYMAPEQLAGGEIGPSVDMFAWALTLVYAATGRRAFAGDTPPSVMNAILNDTPDLSGLPAWLIGLAAACLDKDPRRRPTAVQALMHLLGMAPGARQTDVATLLTQGAAAATTQPWTSPPSASRTVPPPAVVSVALGAFTNVFSTAGLNIGLSGLSRDLGASASALGSMVGATVLGLVLGVILTGRLADRFGRKWLFVIGTVGCGLTTIATGLAPTIAAVIVLCFVQGILAGLALPAGLALIRGAFSGNRLHIAVVACGLAVGVFSLAGVFLSWRIVFEFTGLLGLMAAVVSAIAL